VSVPPTTPEDAPLVRIGELSRRTGVGVDTLRAWERRYGLLKPRRSPGGFRLYGTGDQERVRAMKTLIDSGVSAAEAARLAKSESPAGPGEPGERVGDHGPRLTLALERFDETDANAIIDDALARFTVGAVASRIFLPVLREIGKRWERGEISVAQEHFAAGILRARMLSVGRNWGAGSGPRALLACPPGERHDLGLIAFGLVLRERGWRITFLGSDTPIETIVDAAARLKPAAVVLSAVTRQPFEAVADGIRHLSGDTPVLIGGEGASEELGERLGAKALQPDPVRAAAGMASST
jgi:MerR family transcriptional regulator, light-induced transcriptional regulator